MGVFLFIIEGLIIGTAAYFVIWLLTSPIKDVPGPLLAKFTNMWRLFNVWQGSAELTQLRLHRQCGPAVRLGPNCVSLSDPELIKTVYSTKSKWTKV